MNESTMKDLFDRLGCIEQSIASIKTQLDIRCNIHAKLIEDNEKKFAEQAKKISKTNIGFAYSVALIFAINSFALAVVATMSASGLEALSKCVKQAIELSAR